MKAREGQGWGERGEGYVAAQVALLAGIAAAPLLERPDGLPAVRAVGWGLLMAGGGLCVWSARALGRNLTPFPKPRADAEFVEAGPYGLVRHPIYGGLLLVALGWSLARGGGETLALSGLLAALFDLKARREEAWLSERFPQYAAYRCRTRRFIPLVY